MPVVAGVHGWRERQGLEILSRSIPPMDRANLACIWVWRVRQTPQGQLHNVIRINERFEEHDQPLLLAMRAQEADPDSRATLWLHLKSNPARLKFGKSVPL